MPGAFGFFSNVGESVRAKPVMLNKWKPVVGSSLPYTGGSECCQALSAAARTTAPYGKTNKPVDKSAPASPYADQVRLQKKFFEAGAGLMQHPSLVANVIARLLGDSAGWKAYYTVGRDGEALTKTVLGRGLDYVVQSAQKKETDDEYIARMREWGVDVSKPFKKKAARL